MRHLLKAVGRVFFSLIFGFFAWILPYSGKNKEKYPLNTRYARSRKLIMNVNKALNMDVHIEGKENIPEEACCFFANHLGACDPLSMFEAIEKPTAFVAKIEVKKMPFVGRIFSAGNGLFLDRKDLKQQLRIMMKVQDSLTNKEHNWFIFPEGTRNKDQMALIQPFHYGTFRAAMRANAPIVPVAQFSSFRLLSTKHNFKKYPTFVKILPPIYPSEYEGKTTEEVSVMVRSRIQKVVSFELRPLDHKYMLEHTKKGYRFNEVY